MADYFLEDFVQGFWDGYVDTQREIQSIVGAQGKINTDFLARMTERIWQHGQKQEYYNSGEMSVAFENFDQAKKLLASILKKDVAETLEARFQNFKTARDQAANEYEAWNRETRCDEILDIYRLVKGCSEKLGQKFVVGELEKYNNFRQVVDSKNVGLEDKTTKYKSQQFEDRADLKF